MEIKWKVDSVFIRPFEKAQPPERIKLLKYDNSVCCR